MLLNYPKDSCDSSVMLNMQLDQRTSGCGHASWITQVQRADVQLIKVVDNCFIFCIFLSVSIQPLQEVLLLIVVLLHQPLRQVHHPILQEAV